MGSCALALCDVAAGAFDGYFDGGSVARAVGLPRWPPRVQRGGRDGWSMRRTVPLGIGDPNVRRHLVAAGTEALLDTLRQGRRR